MSPGNEGTPPGVPPVDERIPPESGKIPPGIPPGSEEIPPGIPPVDERIPPESGKIPPGSEEIPPGIPPVDERIPPESGKIPPGIPLGDEEIHPGIPPGNERIPPGPSSGDEISETNEGSEINKTELSQDQLSQLFEFTDGGQTTCGKIQLTQHNDPAETRLDTTRVTPSISTSPGREFPGDEFPGGEGEEDDIEEVKVPSGSSPETDRMYKIYKMLARPIGAGGGRVDVSQSIILTSRWKYKWHHMDTYLLLLGP